MASSPRQAPLTTGLLVINLTVFVLMLVFGAGLWHTDSSVPLAWGANFGPATQDDQWWRLFTAMFVHFGFVHLMLNMWALWDIGRLVERLYGPFRFSLLYISSGILGNLLSLVVQGNQAVSGGASGAIFSLYGALLVFLWRERRQVDRGEFKWLFGGAAVFTLLTLGMGQLVAGIDNAAHLGGLAAGACLGTVLARRWVPASPSSWRERWLAAILLTIGAAVLLTRIPPPIYLLGDELRAREAIRQFLAQDMRISQSWGSILARGRGVGTSFEELAGSIETSVTAEYQHSFDQLTAASAGTAAPSTKTLEALQTYASQRADASRELADGLRTQDQAKIRQALDKAKKAQKNASSNASGTSPLVENQKNINKILPEH